MQYLGQRPLHGVQQLHRHRHVGSFGAAHDVLLKITMVNGGYGDIVRRSSIVDRYDGESIMVVVVDTPTWCSSKKIER